jgi:hypothetical protein
MTVHYTGFNSTKVTRFTVSKQRVAISNLVLKKDVNIVLPVKYIVNLFSDICTESQEFTVNSM